MQNTSLHKLKTNTKWAIALNPSYANAHHWRALSLVSLGRYQEAIKELRLAEEADPLSVTILGLEVLWFGILGMREEAARKLEKAIEIDPDHLFVIDVHGTYYYLRRDYQRAIRILRLARTNPKIESTS